MKNFFLQKILRYENKKITYIFLFYSFLYTHTHIYIFLTVCKYFTEQKILDFFEGRVISTRVHVFFWHKKNWSVSRCSRMQCFIIF